MYSFVKLLRAAAKAQPASLLQLYPREELLLSEWTVDDLASRLFVEEEPDHLGKGAREADRRPRQRRSDRGEHDAEAVRVLLERSKRAE